MKWTAYLLFVAWQIAKAERNLPMDSRAPPHSTGLEWMDDFSKLPRAILQHRRRIVQQQHGSQAHGYNDAV